MNDENEQARAWLWLCNGWRWAVTLERTPTPAHEGETWEPKGEFTGANLDDASRNAAAAIPADATRPEALMPVNRGPEPRFWGALRRNDRLVWLSEGMYGSRFGALAAAWLEGDKMAGHVRKEFEP